MATQTFFNVHPYLGKMNPIWRAYVSNGLVQPHQLALFEKGSNKFSWWKTPLFVELDSAVRWVVAAGESLDRPRLPNSPNVRYGMFSFSSSHKNPSLKDQSSAANDWKNIGRGSKRLSLFSDFPKSPVTIIIPKKSTGRIFSQSGRASLVSLMGILVLFTLRYFRWVCRIVLNGVIIPINGPYTWMSYNSVYNLGAVVIFFVPFFCLFPCFLGREQGTILFLRRRGY